MIVARSRSELARGLASLRGDGGRGSARLGLVPTMGFLHEGHLSLVDLARSRADAVCVSIFVNPLQFGPHEDLASYPRDPERDLELLEARGSDLVFLPAVEQVYPEGEPAISVDPGPLGARLEGGYRPSHFRGVLTVVAKLFGLFRPEVAIFGQKDFQQLVLIERMVRDLDLPVEVVRGPTVRERDGLAMSSRNSYLSAEERRAAPTLHRGLAAAAAAFRGGERRAPALLDALHGELEGQPLLKLEYAEIVSRRSLERADPVRAGDVLALAAHCGRTRLIDNVTLETH